ncbi:MAG: cob(I)yrinic acid a,c-diamide adenosyltransferase [Candidatus Micrarchaeota archaeon]|nr:cob(I)yrinic acid a,c-diamide adenosyltransferase [Candidatus Micrarchaeota archaeon]
MPRKQGLVHVLTGDGNGKTTSAVGVAVRACGHGLKVAFVQFLKGGLSGEVSAMRKLGIEVISGTKHCPKNPEHADFMAKNGYVFFCKDCFVVNDEDRRLAREAFRKAQELCWSGQYHLVVLDEIFWAMKEKLVSEEEVLNLLKSKSPSCEIVLTGRGATKAIEEASDYLTYVNKGKHPFDKGVISRAGIDY